MTKEEEYIACRDEYGRLIGFHGPDGIERVDEHYEERMKLKKIEEKLDVIIAMLKQGDLSLFKY